MKFVAAEMMEVVEMMIFALFVAVELAVELMKSVLLAAAELAAVVCICTILVLLVVALE